MDSLTGMFKLRPSILKIIIKSRNKNLSSGCYHGENRSGDTENRILLSHGVDKRKGGNSRRLSGEKHELERCRLGETLSIRDRGVI